MFALSSSLSAHVPSDCCIDGIVAESSSLFSKTSFFLRPVLMFLEKKDCYEFLNIVIHYACLYIFSRPQLTLMILPFGIKCFRFCIARFKFFILIAKGDSYV